MRRLLNSLHYSCGNLKRTALYDFHVAHKGKIVPFAGYELPVQFDSGVLKEHMHCRTKCAVFDVSHMGQINIKGPDVLKFIERVTVGAVKKKSVGDIYESYLSLILNPRAGIIDDTIVTYFQKEKEINMVVNGSNKDKVMAHFQQQKSKGNYNVQICLDDARSLVSVQGPEASKVIQSVLSGFRTEGIPFMSQFTYKDPNFKHHILVSRTSYAGTDGFEISLDNSEVVKFMESVMKHPDAKLAGLGARDSLRVEAGLCLHGHDINEDTTPFEASLMWTVRKDTTGKQPFIGQQVLDEQVAKTKEKKIKVQKRVGFTVQQAGIVREGGMVLNDKMEKVGKVTSGTYSPILKKGIGMMYVDQKYVKPETDVVIQVGDRNYSAKVSKMPFVEVGYNRLWDKL